MSDPILPLLQWPPGIQQASVPANENALRLEVLSRPVIGVANDESSPMDGDAWLVGSSPTGAFAAFDQHDLALYHVDELSAVGGWHSWAPVEGIRVVVNNVRKIFNGTSWIDDPSVSGGGGGGILGWFNVVDYGAEGDGSTDDTVAIQDAIDAAAAAGGGVVYFPAGEYIVAGALQDTSNANAQIVLPSIDVLTGDQITIELRGPFAPTPDISVIGDIPVSMSGAIIRSTLTTGSGGNCIGGYGPSGSAGGFTNILFSLRDITVRLPANPTHSAVDLRRVACVEIENVVIDAGSYYIQGLAEPSASGSYGLRMPRQNNGALSRLGTVNVVGFYNGFEFAEHCNGYACQAAWGCKRAFVFASATSHAAQFCRLMAHHCERVIVGEGVSYVNIAQLNVEHATSGWWVTDYDIDDASNNIYGEVNWHAILAGSGVSNTFTVNGANRLTIRQIGAADDAIAGLIAEPSDKDYRLVVKAPHRGRIVETTTVCASGSCTAAFKINSTALGGTANSVTTSEQSQSHSSSNTFAAGDDLVVTISANSTCLDLSFCIRYQRL